MIISLVKKTGDFAENKDVAREIREQLIKPALIKGENITIDFEGVSGTTQSFVHALITDSIREYGEDIYDRLVFKNCSSTVREVVNIVADYMEESK